MCELPIMCSRGRVSSASIDHRSSDRPILCTIWSMSTTEPRWKRRYRAPLLTLPRWAVDNPDHLVYASNVSGSWQVHAWDRAAGGHRQVTEHPTGVVAGAVTPGGGGVGVGAGGLGGGGPPQQGGLLRGGGGGRVAVRRAVPPRAERRGG